MALGTLTSLTSVVHTAASLTTVTGSCSPTAGSLVLVFCTATGSVNGETLSSIAAGFSITGSWTIIGTPPGASSAAVYIAWAFASGSPGSGTVTATWASTGGTDNRVAVFEITGADTTTPIAGTHQPAVATTATTPAATLTQSPTTSDLVIGLFGSRNKAGTITPGSGFTAALQDFTTPNPTATMLVEYKGSTTGTTVDASTMGTAANNAIGIIVKVASGPATLNGAAALSSPSTLTAAGSASTTATAALASVPALTVAAVDTSFGVAAMSSAVAMTVAGLPTVVATAALSSPSSLTVAASVTEVATAALASVPALTVAATASTTATAALSSVPVMTTGSVVTTTGVVAMSSASLLVVAGAVTDVASVALSSVPALTVAASVATTATAALSSAAVMTTAGTRGVDGAATLSSAVALAVDGVVTAVASASLSSVPTLSADSLVTVLAAATLSSTSALTAAGSADVQAAAALSSAAVLTADGFATVIADATLSSVPVLTADATAESLAAAALSSAVSLVGGGVLRVDGIVSMSSAIDLTAGGEVSKVGAVALSSGSVLTAAASVATTAAAALSSAAVLTATLSPTFFYFEENFEGASPGTTLSTSNTGFNSTSGATLPVFDATAVFRRQSALFTYSANSGQLRKTINPADPTIVRMRGFIRVPTGGTPTSSSQWFVMRGAAANVTVLQLTTGRAIRLLNVATAVATTTATLTLDTTYYWEYETVGATQTFRLYSANGQTLIETISGAAPSTAIDQIGLGSTAVVTLSYYIDALAVGNTQPGYPVTAALSSSPVLTAFGDVPSENPANLTSASTLTVAGTATAFADAALSSASSLTAAGDINAQATTNLSSASSLSVTASVDVQASATLASTPQLTAGATATGAGAVTLSSGSSLTVGGIVTAQASTVLSSSSTLTVAATATVIASAVLSSAAVLHLDVGAVFQGEAALTSASQLAVAATVRQFASATLSSLSSMTVEGAYFTPPPRITHGKVRILPPRGGSGANVLNLRAGIKVISHDTEVELL